MAANLGFVEGFAKISAILIVLEELEYLYHILKKFNYWQKKYCQVNSLDRDFAVS
ncbi:hypothetical protein LAG90_13530 [Marinilongibacter aquaticus]|uniref:hypothetical protein n=1 Tax=Marinilongibacter aquaticus TaxID=2975157 RepID=UPI0021BD9093|nr:hypothetical protein [Marinilongibacter aquaticus]UBM57827.1 hypothetical protein LAG90_13530 [Marinilongibacter aquaticus]